MEGNKQIDLGGFALYDSNPLIVRSEGQNSVEDAITQRLIENIQFIFQTAVTAKKQEIATLESLPEEEQIHDFEQSKLYLQLPESSTLLPRSKRLPEKKTLTKWQKFAKEKGIQKKKREGMHYDKTLKKQVARWGKKSGKNQLEPAIMEQKQPGRNPFLDAKNSKKLLRQSNKLKQIKNKQYRKRLKQ